MAFSTQSSRLDRVNAGAISIALLATIRAKAKAALRGLQMGRMLSTLSNMSDYQLAQIGISRSDIPEYAEKLLADE